MLALGASVGQYIVERVIGRGGMATVYRVRHRDLGTQHALKVLHVQRRGLRERFLQEGRLQANIRHPNLVAVTDVVWSGEHPGLVLELVDGPTLADVVAQGPLPVTEALRLFRQIVDGVHHAHAQGLVHRDLKPQNVLLGTGTDGLRQARVADFGIAKVLAGSEEPALTRSGMPIGTPRYMAPEQIRDASRVDARADIFSLGCILYEMVCGAIRCRAPTSSRCTIRRCRAATPTRRARLSCRRRRPSRFAEPSREIAAAGFRTAAP